MKTNRKTKAQRSPNRLTTSEGIACDSADRKRAENELRKKNRALTTLSACNQALIRATDEMELLNEICRICVEMGGYRMAWVGYAESDERKSVRPVAQKGFEEGYLDTVNITWADTERGRGPTGTAIRTRQPCIVRNIPGDPNFAPWRAAAVQRGYASSIALPLIPPFIPPAKRRGKRRGNRRAEHLHG